MILQGMVNFPRFSLAVAFIMIMLCMQKPQQQATLTEDVQIPEMFFRFRFRNSTERKSKIPAFTMGLLWITQVIPRELLDEIIL